MVSLDMIGLVQQLLRWFAKGWRHTRPFLELDMVELDNGDTALGVSVSGTSLLVFIRSNTYRLKIDYGAVKLHD